MTSFKHRQKIRKVDALNVIYKSIIYKLRNKDVIGKRSSVLLSIVIFFIIFVCLLIKRYFLHIYWQFRLPTSGEVIFIPYILLPSTYEVMLLICKRVTCLSAGWPTGNDQKSDTKYYLLILLFELESTSYHNHLDAEYIWIK